MVQQTKYHTWEICSRIFSSCKLAQVPGPRPSTDQLRDPSEPPLSSIWISLHGPVGPFCLGFSSAMPLNQTDLFLQAGLCPGTSVLSDPEVAAFQLCSEHSGETQLGCYQWEMHERYWGTCTLLSAQGRRLSLPHAGEQYFDSCLEVTARVVTESKYISYWMLVTDKLGLELLHLNQINTKHFTL